MHELYQCQTLDLQCSLTGTSGCKICDWVTFEHMLGKEQVCLREQSSLYAATILPTAISCMQTGSIAGMS